MNDSFDIRIKLYVPKIWRLLEAGRILEADHLYSKNQDLYVEGYYQEERGKYLQKPTVQKAIKTQVELYLSSGNYELANNLYHNACEDWWVKKDYLEFLKKGLKVKIYNQLSAGDFDSANALYHQSCSSWWSEVNFQALTCRYREAAKRKQTANRVRHLLASGHILEADILFENDCKQWWRSGDYKKTRNFYAHKIIRKHTRRRIIEFFINGQDEEADDLYKNHCSYWWPINNYVKLKNLLICAGRFTRTYKTGTLAQLDALFLRHNKKCALGLNEYLYIKHWRLKEHFKEIGMDLDFEQEYAISHPGTRLQVIARAGSGKTRTLCARAAISVIDERLDPNQVLILAFNKNAAEEIRHRVIESTRAINYKNARTFHSLAYQLVQPLERLLFDSGGEPSEMEQSKFIQRLIERILNPVFKELMYEFFRAEMEQIEEIGRDLRPDDYYAFRRSLKMVTLKGERVKSNGEKFIADFLFEHNIEYRYEKAWVWKCDFLGGNTYKPDFTILFNGRDYILEHWAFNIDEGPATLPTHWNITASEYVSQAADKRAFWRSKDITLLETHAGQVLKGRQSFERILKYTLHRVGIRCGKLGQLELITRVFDNDFTISRIAKLLTQFIQRARKRGLTANDMKTLVANEKNVEKRIKIFYELALKAFYEYEKTLLDDNAIDFDLLLARAQGVIKSFGADAKINLGRGASIPIKDIKWVLIDEYQDFSELYYQMLLALINANPNVRVMAVGDDWQAINGFAGAELRFFYEFQRYFSDATAVTITTNYRSASAIVSASNNLMKGTGVTARPRNGAARGKVEVIYTDRIWIEFRDCSSCYSERIKDKLYLGNLATGKSPSESMLRQAQAIKACVDILGRLFGHNWIELFDSLVNDLSILLLSRTGRAYGLILDEFLNRFVYVIENLAGVQKERILRNVSIKTVHKSKGIEADVVILLDATEREFPKIHPDNLLFGVFGVNALSIINEERRLFYVAVTRARNNLFLLSETGKESPFFKSLQPFNDEEILVYANSHKYDKEDVVLGELGKRIASMI